MDDRLLLAPGPVPVEPAVSEAMDAPMLSRRSDAFGEVYEHVRAGLDHVFTRSTPDGSRTATDGESLVLNGTATMGMEALVSNLVGPDDEVVAVTNGAFGDRFARIAEQYASVTRVGAEWGRSVEPAAVREAVTDETALVLAVHNETSTGLRNPVAAVGEVAADHDALFAVDGVSSVGGEEFRVDDWHVDAVVTDPQKALAAPPGVSALYLSPTAIDAIDAAGAPVYHDLETYLDAAAEGATPFTCASPQFRAFAVALELIQREGMPDRIDRHRRRAEAVREGMRAMGLDLFGTPSGATERANTLTAVSLPAEARDDHAAFFDGVKERGVEIGGGIGRLDGRVFRVSNMGAISEEDLCLGVRAVGEALCDVGADVSTEAGVEAVRARLA